MADRPTAAPPRPGMMRTFAGILLDRLGLAARLGWSYDGQRNLYDMVGYKKVLAYEDFLARYERHDMAHRCVHLYPDLTWAYPPLVQETKTEQRDTAFEVAWQGLVRRLKLFRVLKRLDLLANLGHYSVLLLGLKGQADLQQPAQAVQGPAGLLYLQPYGERGATIETWETNPALATYGQPRTYRLHTESALTGTRGPAPGLLVHASRVLHVAEDTLEDEVVGTPRLQPLFNRLDDLDKLVALSIEGYARDHRRRLALTTQKDFELSPEDREAVKEQVEHYGMGWTDFLTLSGLDVQPLSGQSVSPKEHFEVIVACIAAGMPVPKSVLLGAEQGTLASAAEEAQSLKEKLQEREQDFAEPVILRALIDRLTDLQVLPAVASYSVLWQHQRALSEPQRAQVAKDKATAIAQYDASRVATARVGLPVTVPRPEFREQVLNLPPESVYPEDEVPDLLPLDAGPGTPPAPPALGDQVAVDAVG